MKILMICGSRNPAGQTAAAAEAVLQGAQVAGAAVDRVFLPVLRLEHCRQCEDSGWGACRRQGRCVLDDAFAALVEQVRQADALVAATPVYYADLSESLRALTDRLRRICTHEAGRRSLRGKPMVGVCVAGGGGGGAPACCVSLEKVMTTCGFEVLDMIPVRRQNLDAKLAPLRLAG